MSLRCVRGPWRVLGTGVALPGSPINTDDLLRGIEEHFGVRVRSAGMRLAGRLGVQTRHFCRDFSETSEVPREGESNPKLAAMALRAALSEAALIPAALGYLLGHTTTPHTLLPSNAAWVADELGYAGPFAELRQACAGFAHALQMCAGLLATGDAPVAIIGSETGSIFMDPRRAGRELEQLLNLVQMGDGAGAIVLGHDSGAPGAVITDAFVGSLGPGHAPGFWLESGGSSRPFVEGIPHFRHDGVGVRAQGARLFDRAIACAAELGIRVRETDYVLPHQANAVELPLALSERLGVPRERIVVDGDRVGNLGSASIWVALHRLRASGRLQQGQRVIVLGAEATKYLFGGFVYTHG